MPKKTDVVTIPVGDVSVPVYHLIYGRGCTSGYAFSHPGFGEVVRVNFESGDSMVMNTKFLYEVPESKQ
jgi:hypothetical protein